MATKSFTATIKGKEITVFQNSCTGLFYTILDDGRHTPVDYHLIKTQATSMQRLRYWRNRYGYTQADLAALIHVSSPTVIMMWENGLRHPLKKYRRAINDTLFWDIYPD